MPCAVPGRYAPHVCGRPPGPHVPGRSFLGRSAYISCVMDICCCYCCCALVVVHEVDIDRLFGGGGGTTFCFGYGGGGTAPDELELPPPACDLGGAGGGAGIPPSASVGHEPSSNPPAPGAVGHAGGGLMPTGGVRKRVLSGSCYPGARSNFFFHAGGGGGTCPIEDDGTLDTFDITELLSSHDLFSQSSSRFCFSRSFFAHGGGGGGGCSIPNKLALSPPC